ncbi:MAG: sulfotransferase, partial [Pseudomonadota bacterium]
AKRQDLAVDQIRRLVARGLPLGAHGPELLQLSLAVADEDIALEIAKAVTRERPNDHRQAFVLAERYSRIGRSDIALQVIEDLARTAPPNPALDYFKAVYSGHLGKLDEAAASARRAVQKKPDFGDAWAVLIATGQYSEADQMPLKRLIDASPPHAFPGAAYALGTIYHDKGEAELAWGTWSKANEIGKQKQAYNVSVDVSAMHDIASTFSKLADPAPKASVEDTDAGPQPIFIVGAPRSGTSLTEQIIATAPQTFAMGETLFSRLATWSLGNLNYSDIESAGGFQSGQINWALIGDVYRKLSRIRSVGAGYVTDKGAILNLFIGALARALPNAKFVWVHRDKRDIALSAWRTYLTGGSRWRHSLEDAKAYLSAHETMMAQWYEALPGRLHRLSYEELVRSPQTEVEDLMGFLGLKAPDLDRTDLSGVNVSTASFAQIRSKITTRSIGGWKTYRKWIDPVFGEGPKSPAPSSL